MTTGISVLPVNRFLAFVTAWRNSEFGKVLFVGYICLDNE